MLRRSLLLPAACLAVVWPKTTARGQVILGSVTDHQTKSPVGYAVVAIDGTDRLFTSDHGAFLVPGLREGPVRIRVRHIGYTALDTIVNLHRGDSVHLSVNLSRLALDLEQVHVVGQSIQFAVGCPAPSGSVEGGRLLGLLEQVALNAQQFRLLAQAHPFSSTFSDIPIIRRTDGTRTVDTAAMESAITNKFVLPASSHPVYQPGKIFRTAHGKDEVFAPELQDLGDSTFFANHCFSFLSDTTIRNQSAVRLAFMPAPTLTDVDIQGVIALRRDDYALLAVDMESVGPMPRKVEARIASVRIVTSYREVLPGISILAHLESFLRPGTETVKKDPGIASRGEIQELLEVSWKNGPPL